jgi:CheY-like chemotaxis protein
MLGLISSLIGPVSDILDKVVTDKDLKEKLSHDIATMAERHAHEVVKAQIEVNKTEAQHHSMFVAGWRPAIGWVCCLGMAGNFLIIPFVNMALELLETGVVVPMIELDLMMPVLMGMLGLGAMRTVEKVKKVDRKA